MNVQSYMIIVENENEISSVKRIPNCWTFRWKAVVCYSVLWCAMVCSTLYITIFSNNIEEADISGILLNHNLNGMNS